MPQQTQQPSGRFQGLFHRFQRRVSQRAGNPDHPCQRPVVRLGMAAARCDNQQVPKTSEPASRESRPSVPEACS